MRTEAQAIEKAKQIAHATGKDIFVVRSTDENDEPGNDYHAATVEDLETYFAGCPILYVTGE